MTNPLLDGKLESLRELRKRYDGQRATWDDLDKKAGAFLSAGSLLLSIVSALELSQLHPSPLWVMWGPLAVAGALYLVMVFLLLRAYFPTEYRYPIKSEWEWLGSRIYQCQDEELLLKLIRQYLGAIEDNDKQVKRKGEDVKLAIRLLGAQVILLLAAGILGRIIG